MVKLNIQTIQNSKCYDAYVSFIAMLEGNDDWKDNWVHEYYSAQIPTEGGGDPFSWVGLDDDIAYVTFLGGGWDQPLGCHAFSMDGGTWKGFDHDICMLMTHSQYASTTYAG